MRRLTFLAMHFVLACNLTIGGLEAGPLVNDISVNSGWRELTDEARITMPKKVFDYGLVDFKPGDAVSIEMGYLIPIYDATQNQVNSSKYLRNVFSGYVAEVNPKIPVEILCEDASWLCKRSPLLSKGWTEPVTLKEILTYVVNETNTAHPDKTNITFDTRHLPDITFETFRIVNQNAAQVLQKFKEDPYNLAIYFRDHQLKVHLAYLDLSDSPGQVAYFLQSGSAGLRNVIDHDLEYRNTDQNKVQVKAVIMKDDNSFTEQLYGEPGGDTYTLTFYKDEEPKIVEELSKAQLKRFGEGYRGTLKTFMIPYATHGMTARVVDPEFRRDSRYHVDATTIRYDDGITITVELGTSV